MSLTKSQTKAIRDHVLADVDDETKRLIALASWDLFYGPITEPDDDMPWPGFEKACEEIRAAISVRDLYIDDQSDCISDREPECQCEDREACDGGCCNDWYHIDSRDVLAIVVGKELAPYVR